MSAVGSILTNTGALDALQSISTTSSLNNTLEGEMSTGLAISSPSDNPAGYITAQGFTSQLNGLTQATSNANQGVSLLQTATGALQQQIGILQQLNSTAVQAANGTETSSEGTSLQSVVSQLTSQVSSIASQTQFNNVSLLNGTFNNVQFQVGANEGQTMSLSIGNTSATSLGMYQTAGTASTLSGTTGGTYENVGQLATANAVSSGTSISAGSGDAPTALTVNGKAVTISATSGEESAASLAAAINSTAGVGVTATATTSFNLGQVETGTGGGSLSFTLASSSDGTLTSAGSKMVSGTSASALVNSINKYTGTTGVSASLNNGSLVLTQAQGENIQLSGYTSTAGSPQLTNSTATAASTTGDYMVMQGTVQMSSPTAIAMTSTPATSNMIGTAGTTPVPGLTATNLQNGSGGAAQKFGISLGGVALGSVTPTNSLESAASLAAQVNSMDGAKGVTASASNVVNLGQMTTGTGELSLTLAASGSGKTTGTAYQATGGSANALMASINKGTGDTGISASVNSQGSLILTQASAENIQVSGYSAAANGPTLTSVSAAAASDSNYISIQGGVQLAGGSEISATTPAGGTATPMVSGTSTFTSLADVNVSTVNGATPTAGTANYDADLNTQGGANQAISVVNYALDSLNNSGGQLGAVQEGLTANINNLSTTSENVTSALGTVQDANLPQVANQLTQAQIQAQAGVAALKSSTTLQQSYLSLLP